MKIRCRSAIRRLLCGTLKGVIAVQLFSCIAFAQESPAPPTTPASAPRVARPSHALEPALERAREGLAYIRENVDDYTATIIKRERIKGKLKEHEFMFAKIRNRKVQDGKVVVPFAVYMKFLKPDSVKGREVIWVEGKNEGKLIAHETGLLGFKRFHLPPDGLISMMGQRYPITDIGIENLVVELIERGNRDLEYPECDVKFYKKAKVDEYICMVIDVIHPTKRDHFDYYRARIYIDDALQVPVRYASWSWPETPGGELLLEEEYTYRNIKLNVGLTDKDFDPDNPAYAFP
ncbi:MAG: hypothetical protein CMJ64_10985 [Planctomycetaceae bacterium]|nr:hypothetical protein [Planctomycetaceae bacterium]